MYVSIPTTYKFITHYHWYLTIHCIMNPNPQPEFPVRKKWSFTWMTKCEMGLSEVLLPLALSLMTLYGFFLDDKLFEKEVQCKHYDQHFKHYLPRMLRPVLSDKILNKFVNTFQFVGSLRFGRIDGQLIDCNKLLHAFLYGSQDLHLLINSSSRNM